MIYTFYFRDLLKGNLIPVHSQDVSYSKEVAQYIISYFQFSICEETECSCTIEFTNPTVLFQKMSRVHNILRESVESIEVLKEFSLSVPVVDILKKDFSYFINQYNADELDPEKARSLDYATEYLRNHQMLDLAISILRLN